LNKYYTPQQLAYFIYDNNLNLIETNKLIEELYHKEYAFIDSKYYNEKNLFKKNTNRYVYFLLFEEEFKQEIMKEKNNNYLDEFTEFIKIASNFFIITRLTLIFDKQYLRIKLRTLLRLYGYKRKTSSIISEFHDNFIFYHLETYHKKDLKDISEFELDDWITIKLKL